MKRMPTKRLANEQFANFILTTSTKIGNYWVPARPLPFIGGFFFNMKVRFSLAWDVFCGKADALYWMGNQ